MLLAQGGVPGGLPRAQDTCRAWLWGSRPYLALQALPPGVLAAGKPRRLSLDRLCQVLFFDLSILFPPHQSSGHARAFLDLATLISLAIFFAYFQDFLESRPYFSWFYFIRFHFLPKGDHSECRKVWKYTLFFLSYWGGKADEGLCGTSGSSPPSSNPRTYGHLLAGLQIRACPLPWGPC